MRTYTIKATLYTLLGEQSFCFSEKSSEEAKKILSDLREASDPEDREWELLREDDCGEVSMIRRLRRLSGGRSMKRYEWIVYGMSDSYRRCNQTAEQVKEDIKRIRPLVKSREVLGWSLYKQGFIGPKQRHSIRLCKVDPFGRNFEGPGVEERNRAFI